MRPLSERDSQRQCNSNRDECQEIVAEDVTDWLGAPHIQHFSFFDAPLPEKDN
jgi:hypothetical protein